MFGLSEAHYNIVKQAARRCAEDIKTTIKRDKATYDQVAAKKISEHHEKINTLVSRGQFIWLIGYLQGRFGSQNAEYE